MVREYSLCVDTFNTIKTVVVGWELAKILFVLQRLLVFYVCFKMSPMCGVIFISVGSNLLTVLFKSASFFMFFLKV